MMAEGGIAMTLQSSIVFIAILIGTVLLILLGRPLLRVLFQPFLVTGRYVLSPIYRGLRRLFGAARTVAGPTPHGAPAQLGAAPYKAVVHLLDMDSQAKKALGDIPPALKAGVGRQGLLFKSANANRVVDDLHSSLTVEDARRNAEFAHTFYGRKLGQDINPGILYEDSEETLIINMLNETDQPFFYVLRRINRNVSRNALKIISVLTLIVVLFPFVASIVVNWADAHQWSSYHKLVYGVMCATFLAMLVLFRTFYSYSAQKNGQHFNHFVQTYFGRLLNQYKSASGAFANVLNDRNTDLETIEDNADMWFVNLHWLSIRQWFLELYVRNIFFQIGRNLWWYYLTVPLFFLIVVPIAYVFAFPALGWLIAEGARLLHGGDGGSIRVIWDFRWDFWRVTVPFIALFALYWVSLSGLLTQFWYEITPDGWLGFRTMDIKAAIEANLGPIVKEVVDKRRNPYGRQEAYVLPPR